MFGTHTGPPSKTREILKMMSKSDDKLTVTPLSLQDHGLVYEVLPYIFIPQQFMQPSLFEPVRQASLVFIPNPVIEPSSDNFLPRQAVAKETFQAAIELLKESIDHGLFFNPNQGDVFEPIIDMPPLIAHAVHLYQVDKLGVPYIDHPKSVAFNTEQAILANSDSFSDDEIDAALAAAWLHDVLEDSEQYFYRQITPDDLLNWGVNERAIQLVSLMTRYSDVASELYYLRIFKDQTARTIKLADIAHNLNAARASALEAPEREKLQGKYEKALQHLDFKPDVETWFRPLVDNLERTANPFASQEAAEAFEAVVSNQPLELRFRGVLSESELSRLSRRALEVSEKQSFSEEDSNLEVVLALFWQCYLIQNNRSFNYNRGLVAEFYARKNKHRSEARTAGPDELYPLQDLTISELLRRAKRASANLEKFNRPILSEVSEAEFDNQEIWVDASDLSPDEAAELALTALCEMNNLDSNRVQIYDIKRILINCLELMKFKGRAIYRFACFSSQEEYDTIDEDDAEIFGCLANSEKEANEILSRKNYWLFYLIDVRALD